MTMDDFEFTEINEAFASVVLGVERGWGPISNERTPTAERSRSAIRSEAPVPSS